MGRKAKAKTLASERDDRELVLSKAATEFRKRGFEKTTVKQVAEACNMLPGSLHYRYNTKEALLLDMNGTFMFGEDRFDESVDFSVHHRANGGALPDAEINQIIRSVYRFLDQKYTDEKYQDNFPSIRNSGHHPSSCLPLDGVICWWRSFTS